MPAASVALNQKVAPKATGSRTEPAPTLAAVPQPAAPDTASPAPVTDGEKPSRDPAPTANPPTVASLQPPAYQVDGLQSDDHAGGKPQGSKFQPTPVPASEALSAKVGQISVEPDGTDVHVVVINVLKVEVENVDVTCRASDLQGLQVAEASTHIGRIGPADVVFDRVLFPSNVATRDDRFECRVRRAAALGGSKP